MFEVDSAGSYTFYYLAYEFSGSVTVADFQFNLIYFPTAYGTVDPVPPSVGPRDSEYSLDVDDRSKSDVAVRHTLQAKGDVSRLLLELSEMKARIEAIESQISAQSDR